MFGYKFLYIYFCALFILIIHFLFILHRIRNKYIQLILILTIGIDVYVRVGGNRVPGGNPPA